MGLAHEFLVILVVLVIFQVITVVTAIVAVVIAVVAGFIVAGRRECVEDVGPRCRGHG